ncbi:MAG: M1 family metallopeptidase [Acidobacteriota bacterium]
MIPRPNILGKTESFVLWLTAALCFAGACRQADRLSRPAPPADIHSFARPAEVRVTHMEMDLRVLFDEKILEGRVLLHVARAPGAHELVLDTRHMEILSVDAGGPGGGPLTAAAWNPGPEEPRLGTPLFIELPGEADRVSIQYRTRPDASGLQWLAPEQTAGGQHPFLYSQSEAIHARSWIPCQDSPAVRVTYDATVRVDSPLRAVMAARQVVEERLPGDSATGQERFSFTMPQPIPPYLIALAVGDLEFGPVGKRTGVWAEPALLKQAVWEFADMERMLETAESLYGGYRWGRYDLLVLPPSFPFGGMENPRLTFATPTVLAGDRSLVSLVAHEMAHSWSGNLVTNATWSDFWLNEGFTTYIERRIMEAVYGVERAKMEWMLGRQALADELDSFSNRPGDQVLHINLRGRDPDDGMTEVPYEKGALLLRDLEETYGRTTFDAFLRAWFDEHAFTSVTTGEFVSFLHERLLDTHPPLAGHSPPVLEAWIEGSGLPASAPIVHSDALERVEAAVEQWAGGAVAAGDLETADWTTQHWLHFLHALPDSLSQPQMHELDRAFDFTGTGNNEILDSWLVLTIRHGYTAATPRLEEFLARQGRRKFLTPLYKELMKTPAGRQHARVIYGRARPFYHAIARRTLDDLLHWTAAPAPAETTTTPLRPSSG